jgi:hypothetical protein
VVYAKTPRGGPAQVLDLPQPLQQPAPAILHATARASTGSTQQARACNEQTPTNRRSNRAVTPRHGNAATSGQSAARGLHKRPSLTIMDCTQAADRSHPPWRQDHNTGHGRRDGSVQHGLSVSQPTMKKIYSAAVLMLIVPVASAQTLNSYIGLVHPPDPVNYKEIGGWFDSEKNIASTLVEINGERMYWLKVAIGTATEVAPKGATNTRGIFKVVDVFPAPKALKGETHIVNDDRFCASTKIDVSTETLMAIGKWTKKSPKSDLNTAKIRIAWHINFDKMKFEILQPSEVTCTYSSKALKELIQARD